MRYKGEEIGIPCVEMVQEFIDECALAISAEEVLEYWKPKNFLTKKGQQVKTLEAMVHVANSIFVQKQRKMITAPDETAINAQKWLSKHFKTFCLAMNQLKVKNPQKWQEYYQSCIKLGDS